MTITPPLTLALVFAAFAYFAFALLSFALFLIGFSPRFRARVRRWALQWLGVKHENRAPDAYQAVEGYRWLLSERTELGEIADLAARMVEEQTGAKTVALYLVRPAGNAEAVELMRILPETQGRLETGEHPVLSTSPPTTPSANGASILNFPPPIIRPAYALLPRISPITRAFTEGTFITSLMLNAPAFVLAHEAERAFFRAQEAQFFQPIVYNGEWIGLIGCTPSNGSFMPLQIRALAGLAQHSAPALRSARLISELRLQTTRAAALTRSNEASQAQMQQLDAVKSDFITIASHELRTPLAQVRGYADIVEALNEQGMLDQDKTASMMSNLRRAIERMEELVTAMFDVSQLDVNAMDLRFTPVSLESAMRMAIEPLTEAIKGRKLMLIARGLRGLPTVPGDLQRLVQAFRNVVGNALKYTPDGGRIEINGSLVPGKNPVDGDSVLVAITDTGVGIASEHLPLIFEKFYRAADPGLHSTGTYKFMGAGPGLGLTISRGVIEGHGGEIWAESTGHSMDALPGTTFYILLPLTQPEHVRRAVKMEPQPLPLEGGSSLRSRL